MTLVSMMYASKTNKDHNSIKQDLMNILTESIKFNSLNDITGVLYYGHGYFLQYIEGKKTNIDQLFYNTIVKDQRHTHCEILYYAELEKPMFEKWSMKFAPLNQKIKDFFHENHIDEFNPYLLTTHSIGPFIQILSDEPAYDVHKFSNNK
ncbi:BLUF domain-containing protein [Acinetobacter sp. S40]|uniref:BLUF domain-containing protein n=1 Tax=Acinetobacter sp. S40 TaxID=2767434 RepID=UPI0019099D3A|nr:BLUF domain-containing protein [Acinetobacter sp. S40]